MVKFFLVSTVDNIATYEYNPEGNKSKECGIIFSTKTKGEKIKVPFDSACRIGGLYCVNISAVI